LWLQRHALCAGSVDSATTHVKPIPRNIFYGHILQLHVCAAVDHDAIPVAVCPGGLVHVNAGDAGVAKAAVGGARFVDDSSRSAVADPLPHLQASSAFRLPLRRASALLELHAPPL
jgi:hypothetical protein